MTVSVLQPTPATPPEPPAGYRRPPQAALDVLAAPPPPACVVSPTRDRLLLVQGVRYPAVADLAAPMRRLAGLRIDPRTNARHAPPRFTGITVVSVADGQ